jgi:hypothetical protein
LHYQVYLIYLHFYRPGIIIPDMKIFIFIVPFILSFSFLDAQPDDLALCVQGLSIHPENQRDFAEYYDRKLDSHGDFVFTPGFLIWYDRAVSNEWCSHVRFIGGYISDCIKYPAGFIGAGAVFPVTEKRDYSVNGCIGAGWYGRKDWSRRVDNYYSPVLQRTGSVEWMIMPYPEIELRLHPWSLPCSIVISFSSVIYVSQLSAGVLMNI